LEALQKKKKELEARLANIKKSGGGGTGTGGGLSADQKAKMDARLAELRAKNAK